MMLDFIEKMALAPEYISYAFPVCGYFWSHNGLAKRGAKRKKDVTRYPNGEIKAEVVLTPERRQHDTVELDEKPIADDEGRPSRPYRVVDLLGTLHRHGDITAEMRQAGEDFRSQFATAQLDALKASDPGRPLAHGKAVTEMGQRIEGARVSIRRALLAVGNGPYSPWGSCLWHVIGLEHPLKKWAVEQRWSLRWCSQEEALSVLITALTRLKAYYGGSRR